MKAMDRLTDGARERGLFPCAARTERKGSGRGAPELFPDGKLVLFGFRIP
jgi:hypothetical protein